MIDILINGTLTGGVLALFLGIAEYMGLGNVYTLLTNIDYIPMLPQSFGWEIFLHLVVSVLLYIVICKICPMNLSISYYGAIGFIIGLITYFTTLFSARTPDLNDGKAWVSWIIGHIIYGILVGIVRRTPQWKKG